MHRIALFTLLLVFSQQAISDETENAIASVKKSVYQCINNNQYTLAKLQDCTEVAEKTLAKYPASNKLNWSFAELIRRDLGNQVSLKYFQRALQSNVTPENCIDDGLDVAIKAGLNLPYDSYKHDAKIATDIVFKTCWSEYKEEIVEMAKRKQSSYWMDNVCRGAASIKQKHLFADCP
jgi:hypothetical protein